MPQERGLVNGPLGRHRRRFHTSGIFVRVDPRLSEDYKTFMADIVAKGYARKVPLEQMNLQNGKVWYIPHHEEDSGGF